MTFGSRDVDNVIGTAALAVPPLSLTQIMRECTHELHTQAERSGIVKDILRGNASRNGYALLLRNLLPAYRQLEMGLDKNRHTPAIGSAARPELYRAAALESDLSHLVGYDWETELPLLDVGRDYERRIAVSAEEDGTRLLGHAYTRYFGDLNGGQVMKRLLTRALGLQSHELSFYDFPQIAELVKFKEQYRRGFNDSATSIHNIGAVVNEAIVAFELNIALSEAVAQASVAKT
jgi:heme oxygenase (biliverdin-producing, ferredoxin)